MSSIPRGALVEAGVRPFYRRLVQEDYSESFVRADSLSYDI
jgi:hypothetical protein